MTLLALLGAKGLQILNALKGKKGADVLDAGGGDGNRVTGGKGRYQFWISAQQGALVEVTDFNPRKDRLVFDVDLTAVTLNVIGDDSQVLIDGRVVAQLPGVSDLDPERHALFSGFEGL